MAIVGSLGGYIFTEVFKKLKGTFFRHMIHMTKWALRKHNPQSHTSSFISSETSDHTTVHLTSRSSSLGNTNRQTEGAYRC